MGMRLGRALVERIEAIYGGIAKEGSPPHKGRQFRPDELRLGLLQKAKVLDARLTFNETSLHAFCFQRVNVRWQASRETSRNGDSATNTDVGKDEIRHGLGRSFGKELSQALVFEFLPVVSKMQDDFRRIW